MSSRFRNIERLGEGFRIPVSTDEGGYLGRECPEEDCLGYFKVKPGTGLTGQDLPCHCPYCGHSGPPDQFATKDQIEFAKSVAVRKISEAFRKDLKQLEFEHKPRGPLGIGMSMKLKPGSPIPIRHYREKKLETHMTCSMCELSSVRLR